jgi:uncharacterized protein YdcH (DUF465 family)
MPTPEEIAAAEKTKLEEGKLQNPNTSIQDDTIKLEPEVYNALLDRLDELEDKLSKSGGGRKPLTEEELANVVKNPKQQVTEEAINQMKPKDLINVILQHIEETRIQPLLVKIEEMNVRNEVDKLTANGKNQDFFELKDDIYDIAVKNPQLSLKEALSLAREKKGYSREGKPPEDDGSDDNKNPLRHLPPRRIIAGERPGVSRTTTTVANPETRKEAVSQALEEMKKAGKFKI